MNHDIPAVPLVEDDRLPAAASLMGPEIPELLSAAVAAGDGELAGCEIRQILYTPGRKATVRYLAAIRWPGREEPSEETLVGMATSGSLPEDVLVLEGGDERLGFWRWPHDPLLPGLTQAMEPHRIRTLIEDLGGVPGPVELTPLAYRPGRRAVVRVRTEHHELYLKILPAGKAERLYDNHVALERHLPVPGTFGWSEELGLVAFETAPGETLGRALVGGRDVPPPEALLELSETLAATDFEGATECPTRIGRASAHVRLLSTILPAQSDRLERLIGGIGPEDRGALVPVHGDLYESQVMVESGSVSGLLDLDGVGLGEQIDDFANALAHLAVWSLAHDRPNMSLLRYERELLAACDERFDPTDLRRRIAAACIGQATGPFRVQEKGWRKATLKRIALAEKWLAAAGSGEREGIA